MKKHLARLIILGAVLTAGYFLLDRENFSSYTFPTIKMQTKTIVDKLGGTANEMKQSAVGQVADSGLSLVSALAEKSEKLATKIINDVKSETFQVFRKAVNEKVDDFGSNLGIDVRGSGVQIPAPALSLAESPIVFGIQSGAPAYFTIKNRESEKITYEVDWQDGKKSSGEIAVGKSTVLSHEWQKEGEYSLEFKIKNSKSEKLYKLIVSII